MRETTEETAAQMKRRIMKDWKESGCGSRRRKVGVYRIATYNNVIDVHATIAVVFDISLASIAIVITASKIVEDDENYH